MFIIIFIVRSGGGINRAAQNFSRITAHFRLGCIPGNIGHKGFSAPFLDGLDNLAYKDRMDGGIADVVGGMHFDSHPLVFHPLTQMELLKDQVELGR